MSKTFVIAGTTPVVEPPVEFEAYIDGAGNFSVLAKSEGQSQYVFDIVAETGALKRHWMDSSLAEKLGLKTDQSGKIALA